MNFKKLLSMIGMLTIVVPTSITVVACNGPIESNQQYVNNIKDQLTRGINASSLDTTNTQGDALQLLIKSAQKINNSATLSLVKSQDAKTKLKVGENIININITIGSIVDKNVAAKVIKVKAENDQEYVNDIKNALTASAIDGSKLDVTNTQGDALKNLLLPIATNINPTATLSFINNNDANNKLTQTDNILNIKITVKKAVSDKISVIVNKVSGENDQEYVNDIKNALTTSAIDGSKLDVTNNQGDALKNLLLPIATNINPTATLAFVNANDANNKLTQTDNILNIKITVRKVVSDKISVLVNKVSGESDQEYVNDIKNALTANAIDGWELDLTNTQGDALKNLLLPIATNINPNATLAFVNANDANKKLILEENILNIKITVGKAVSDKISVIVYNVSGESDQQYVNEIKNVLTQHPINASPFNVTNTQGDVLENILLPTATNITPNATVSFVNPNDANKKLTQTNNTLIIKITVRKVVSDKISVILYNVSGKSDQEYLNDIENALTANPIDGSKLDVTNTQGDALKNLLLPIATNITPNATLAFDNDNDANNKLTQTDNIINIKITVGKAVSNKISVIVNNVSGENDQEYVNDIKNVLTKYPLDGLSFNVTNTQEDVLEHLLLPTATNITPNATVSFVNPNDANKKLTLEQNILNIKITVGKAVSGEISVILYNVQAQMVKN